jgi:uridine monophosphate synthetase
MIFKRKEAKDYGLKKMVEGVYREGDKCIIIEDVTVYGTSIIDTADCLRSESNLIVKDAITLLDREQGGSSNIHDNDINFHSIIKASDLLNVLCKHGKITTDIMNETIEFLNKHSYQASLHNQIPN